MRRESIFGSFLLKHTLRINIYGFSKSIALLGSDLYQSLLIVHCFAYANMPYGVHQRALPLGLGQEIQKRDVIFINCISCATHRKHKSYFRNGRWLLNNLYHITKPFIMCSKIIHLCFPYTWGGKG